jgi:hypothetical protein
LPLATATSITRTHDDLGGSKKRSLTPHTPHTHSVVSNTHDNRSAAILSSDEG